MLGFAARKILHTLFVALGVVTLVFAALRLSGDPAATMLPGDASVDELRDLRRALGLDRALPLGILAAVHRGRLLDVAAMAFAVVGQATPYFWMGIMLILIVSVELGWLPTSGRGGIQRLILPAVTLGTHFAASLARLTRTSMLEVLGQPFVTTARAKGLSESSVILAHALKNAAVPVVTLIGLQFGTLLGGAVVTETIFAWPGVGRLAVQSIFVRDYPVVQAGVFVLALTFVAINLLVDLLYGLLDPRIRRE
jgi:peptide/nickel transport system permease protein